MATLTGRTIAGRYRLLRLVGEGGMGSVYEAEQALGSTVRSVAVKLLRPEWSHDPAVQARFHREAATVARLEHFNTVRVYDFGTTEDGILFIVMEFLHGRSLQQELDRQGALPPARVLHLAEQVAASLDEAHGLGIVHRDLKPENILLLDSYASQHDVAKIVDFGIAKGQPALGSSTKLTELGAFVGTPAYMSPEQFMGGSVGPRSDVYALGVTTHQMLSGRLPFAAQTVVEWARAHLEAVPAPLAEQYGAGVIPDGMRRAVARALSKSPDDRQSGALEFARELAGHSAAAGGGAGHVGAGESRADEAARRAERAPAPALAPGGGMKTAPMTQLPDLGAEPARGVAATRAMPASGSAWPAAPEAQVPPFEPAHERRGSRWLIVTFATAAALSGIGLVVVALGGQRFLIPGSSEPDVAPPALIPPTRTTLPPEPSKPSPPLEPPEPAPPPAAAKPDPEPAARPTPRPRPAPQPVPAPAPPPAPAAPSAGAGGASALPSGVGGLPSTLPVPPAAAPALPTPQLPWALPTAGACERCVQALAGSGNYTVVTAVAESLLCEDTNARLTCERQIADAAPEVAERAARSGDCPAALATAAAAVKVSVPPERFQSVNALCLR